MYCMYCGHGLTADAVFCPMCGKRQERLAGATPSASPSASPAAGPAAAPSADTTAAPVAAPGTASTQVMPQASRAAFVPAAVPGRGPSSSAAGHPYAASPYRGAGVARASGEPRDTARGTDAAGPRGVAVAAVVLAAFVVLAVGVFVFGRLGASSADSSATAASSAQTQNQGTVTTTAAPTAQVETDTADEDATSQKEIELDGLTTSGDWITYVNPTFGYTVTLPSSFKAVAASEGGEDATFEDAESGIRVDVSAWPNDSGATVESALAEYAGAYDVSYRATGSSWLVASWEDGAGDYYVKEYVGQSYVTRIQYSTPTASHEVGSRLIEDTVNDFKPGSL